MDDSSSPTERGLPTTNVSIVGGLKLSPSWTLSTKNKVVPAKMKVVPTKSALSKDCIPDGEIKVNRHNRIAKDGLCVKGFKLNREMVL